METFTISEAAEFTGLTKKAVRHRVDRGQIRAEKDGGIRRISREELARVGLVPPIVEPPAERAPELTGQVLQLKSALAALERELELSGQAFAQERDQREEAEARADRAVAEAEAERALRRRLAEAGPMERRRLLREIAEHDRAGQVFFRRVVAEDEVY